MIGMMKQVQTYAVETVVAAKATTAALKETIVKLDCSSMELSVQQAQTQSSRSKMN